MPTDQTEDKTQDNGEGTNKLTLYTWNIQDGGGRMKQRFKHVQAAHNKIVEKYEPDIIVINEITNPQGAISPLTTDNYCLLITHLRMRIWVKDIVCVSAITTDKTNGLVFTYKKHNMSIRIWAAHIPWLLGKHSYISEQLKTFTDGFIAIGDFNYPAEKSVMHFSELTIPNPKLNNCKYKNTILTIANNNPSTTETQPISYNTHFGKFKWKSLDYFISNIKANFTVDNIDVRNESNGRASDHNAIVVTLEIPRPDSNDGQ